MKEYVEQTTQSDVQFEITEYIEQTRWGKAIQLIRRVLDNHGWRAEGFELVDETQLDGALERLCCGNPDCAIIETCLNQTTEKQAEINTAMNTLQFEKRR